MTEPRFRPKAQPQIEYYADTSQGPAESDMISSAIADQLSDQNNLMMRMMEKIERLEHLEKQKRAAGEFT